MFRFLTALGVGGEWAAGATLVAEVWPARARAQAAGVLQSAWAVGFMFAALLNLTIGSYGWRMVFLVGVLPALVALWVRRKVREPEAWIAARREGEGGRIRALFEPALRRRTIVASAMCAVAVFGLWGVTNWTPALVREMLAGIAEPEMLRQVSFATMALNGGSLAGYLAYAGISMKLGRRGALSVFFGGSLLVIPCVMLGVHSYDALLWSLPVLGFFTNGIFAGFAVYLPELFPTLVRTTGTGFSYNIGRTIAALGPLITGSLVAFSGSLRLAAVWVGLVYALGLVALKFAPETAPEAIAVE
jgi:MFS family permease